MSKNERDVQRVRERKCGNILHPLKNVIHMPDLKNIYEKFTIDDALEIKNIEKKTNHDVKSVEYSLKNKIESICQIEEL